ncbi:hypothetical protein ACTWQL_20790 [Pseudalkalibacillus sp. R45]|uniref:hypothetical protein n=1 Tax=Pseudalkalibacillus sp. R45 TaxID=3457433 RepID=UPI003FCEBD1F
MPYEEIIQVVDTLIPQDKESFGSVSSHEENAISFSRSLAPCSPINLHKVVHYKNDPKSTIFKKGSTSNVGVGVLAPIP